jgi:hypothetical protein
VSKVIPGTFSDWSYVKGLATATSFAARLLHRQDTVEHDEFPCLHLLELATILKAVEVGFRDDQVKACPGLDPGSNLIFRKRLASTSFSVAVMSDRDGFKLPAG